MRSTYVFIYAKLQTMKLEMIWMSQSQDLRHFKQRGHDPTKINETGYLPFCKGDLL